MTMLRLLVFDPGGTTGWCFLADGKVVGGSFPLWDKVAKLIKGYKPNAILFETFILRSNTAKRLVGNSLPAPQVIGVIRYLSAEYNIPCYSQSPSMRVGIKLKRIYGLDRHALDAVKHGIRYCLRNNCHDYDHLRVQRNG